MNKEVHGELHRVQRENKEELMKRLRRIEGQIKGISRMIEDDRYCVDILNQIAASRAALDRVGLLILETHVRHCVVNALKSGEECESVTELMSVMKRLL